MRGFCYNISHMDIRIAPIGPADVNGAFAVIKSAFEKLVAPGYSREGILEFYKFANPLAMRLRLLGNTMLLGARTPEGEFVGVIEVQDKRHISLLFVHPEHHRKGIASRLVKEACAACGNGDIEVNSSPYAVEAYERMGFTMLSQEQLRNGIRYVPMRRPGRQGGKS